MRPSPSPAGKVLVDRRHVCLAGLVAVTAAACQGRAGRTGPGSGAGSSAPGFPLQLASCDTQLTFDAPPQRVVLLESAPVTTLDGIGVLDRVVARAGSFPPGYYDEDLAARIEAVPALSEDIDAAGHLQISQEVVIAQRPDLVFGLPDGVTREGLRDAGAEALVQEVFCGGLEGRAGFDLLYTEIDTYGRVFARTEEAGALIDTLRKRVGTVGTSAEHLTTASAAVLYPSVGGGPLYTYGAGSMATAQLDALGIENVFAGTADRVFEVGAESLLAVDPDVLIVLYQGGTEGTDVVEKLLAGARFAGLRAVRDEAVLPLLFNFTEPASPLVVDGLERIHEWLADREDAA